MYRLCYLWFGAIMCSLSGFLTGWILVTQVPRKFSFCYESIYRAWHPILQRSRSLGKEIWLLAGGKHLLSWSKYWGLSSWPLLWCLWSATRYLSRLCLLHHRGSVAGVRLIYNSPSSRSSALWIWIGSLHDGSASLLSINLSTLVSRPIVSIFYFLHYHR